MSTMRELFAKLYAHILLFEQTARHGDGQPSYEQVRDELIASLEQHEAEVRRGNIDATDYREACFAFVAWADETVLQLRDWPHRRLWENQSLQFKYYQTRNAGEEFFQHLEDLAPEKRDVREVYYASLGLGFKGRYFTDEARLNGIRHEQANHLTQPVEDVQSIDKLTPQPYEVPYPPRRPPRTPWTRILPLLGLVLLITLPLGYILWRMITTPVQHELQVNVVGNGRVVSTPLGIQCVSTCSHTLEAGTKVTLQPEAGEGWKFVGWSGHSDCAATINLQADTSCTATFAYDLEEKIATYRQASQLQCAAADVYLVEVQDGVVTLAGRLLHAQREQLRQDLRAVEGISEIRDAGLWLIPPVFCDAVELLRPLQAETRRGLSVRLENYGGGGAYPTYQRDDRLMVTFQVPEFARVPTKMVYVYVDYYATFADKAHLDNTYVGHMFPQAKERQNGFRATQSYTVGQAGAQEWEISKPFGLELVTVIASAQPLPVSPRPKVEEAAAYVQELRRALGRSGSADMVASYTFIATHDR
jgi:type IV/VI secretion system ImpK/VasF family protein